jgi:hypothetical protein
MRPREKQRKRERERERTLKHAGCPSPLAVTEKLGPFGRKGFPEETSALLREEKERLTQRCRTKSIPEAGQSSARVLRHTVWPVKKMDGRVRWWSRAHGQAELRGAKHRQKACSSPALCVTSPC